MAVSTVTDSTTPVVGGPARDYSQINQIDFMNLLVAQIQNQDPLSPMNNAEFTSQITQFTMLDEIAQMGASLDESLIMAQSLNNTAMLALVGQDITVEGDEIHVSDGAVSGSKINCSEPGTATVTIRDEDGNVVRTYHKTVDIGLNDVSWDGLGPDEEALADGEYTFEVAVENVDGEAVEATELMTGPVSGLRYENGIAVVEIFGQEFYVSDIYQVS
jgi:flagellar basal-body rod modification protein FlgD